MANYHVNQDTRYAREIGGIPLNSGKDEKYCLSLAIGAKAIKLKVKLMEDVVKFSKEVVEARKQLDQATDMFRADVIEMTESLPKALTQVREWRQTVEREKNMAVSSLQDLRKFFLEKDHDQEMARLRDFVSVCERLAKLSEEGTLDKVADVMLKMED